MYFPSTGTGTGMMQGTGTPTLYNKSFQPWPSPGLPFPGAGGVSWMTLALWAGIAWLAYQAYVEEGG
jgi:hypothetical protein